MNTYPWWPILYTCLLFLMAYSVHIPPHVGLLSISTTYLWPNSYTCAFYGLFCIFISPCWAYLFIFYSCVCLSLLKRYFMTTYLFFMTNSVHIVYYFVYLLLLGGIIFTFSGWLRARLSGDVFCTHTSYGWRILYEGIFQAYSVHISSHVWLFSTRTTSSILFIFFFSASLSLCDVLWVHITLGTYSVHLPPLGDLFCTHGNFWWFILYTYLPILI